MKKFIIIIAILFSLTTSLHSQWIKQNWPGGSVIGTGFFDINTGFVITYNEPYYSLYKTINSGFNWTLNYAIRLYQMQIVEDSAIFIRARDYNNNDKLLRSFNRGVTWDSVDFGLSSITSMYFLSLDTGWIELFDGGRTTLLKTTNGGLNFQEVSYLSSGFAVINNIFIVREKHNGEYIGYRSISDYLQKTTNSGLNWFPLPLLPADVYENSESMYDILQISFLNKDTGWVTNGKTKIYNTINGGNNWILQPVPAINNIVGNGFSFFHILNKDTLYSDGGFMSFGNNVYKGIVYKTTNGGNNWGYQLPDTSFGMNYVRPFFINANTGWFTNIKTTNGGGPIIYTETKNITVEHPEEYKLMQNYPNPFNPSTTIDFYLPKSSTVYLRVYDIAGRLILKVIEGFQLTPGYHSYRIDAFETLGLSSGTYFYRIDARDVRNNSILFTNTKKMLYIK